jgi:hypothetical protein
VQGELLAAFTSVLELLRSIIMLIDAAESAAAAV